MTSRELISEVNHFEQRESPGWKISEQKERHSLRKRKVNDRSHWTEDGRYSNAFHRPSPSVKQLLLLQVRKCEKHGRGDGKITGRKDNQK